VAEFVQRCHRCEIEAPSKWRNRYPAKYLQPPRAGDKEQQHLTGFPEDDKKYLRVFYQVLERYQREKFRYEQTQVDVLREIRDELAHKSKPEDGPEKPGWVLKS
jgi:hypothetical protein